MMERFNPFKKHDWKHAGDKAKHAAEKAAEEAKHTAEKAAEAAKHEAEMAAKALENQIMASIDDIKHLADGLKHDLQGVADKAKHDIEGAEQSAVHSIQGAEQSAVHDIEGAADKAKHGVEGAGDSIKKTLDESGDGWKKLISEAADKGKADIEKAAKSEIADFTIGAVKKGLQEAHDIAIAIEKGIEKLEDKSPTIVEMLNNQSLPINLGPIVLTYAKGVSRIHDIADAIGKVTGQEFKLTQVFINDLLHGLGPDTISIHADVEFFVEVGLDLDDIPFEAFIEIADIVFDALGIPEGE